jgi:ABC-type molybdate transport system substrate-binding protein
LPSYGRSPVLISSPNCQASCRSKIPYSAGVSAKAKDPVTARALVSFLGSAEAQDVLKRKGMDLP